MWVIYKLWFVSVCSNTEQQLLPGEPKYCRCELKKCFPCGNVHNLRLSMAVVSEAVKHGLLFGYDTRKKQNCIRYKIFIRFRYFCLSIFFPKHRRFIRQMIVLKCFYNAIFEVLTAMLLNIQVWDVTCHLVSSSRRFESTMFFRNVDHCSSKDTALHLKDLNLLLCFLLGLLDPWRWDRYVVPKRQ
jgi:hypothetical protein